MLIALSSPPVPMGLFDSVIDDGSTSLGRLSKIWTADRLVVSLSHLSGLERKKPQDKQLEALIRISNNSLSDEESGKYLLG